MMQWKYLSLKITELLKCSSKTATTAGCWSFYRGLGTGAPSGTGTTTWAWNVMRPSAARHRGRTWFGHGSDKCGATQGSYLSGSGLDMTHTGIFPCATGKCSTTQGLHLARLRLELERGANKCDTTQGSHLARPGQVRHNTGKKSR